MLFLTSTRSDNERFDYFLKSAFFVFVSNSFLAFIFFHLCYFSSSCCCFFVTMSRSLGQEFRIQVEDAEDFQNHLDFCAESKGMVIVDVFTEWCGPCKAVLTSFKKFNLEYVDKIPLRFLLVDSQVIVDSARKIMGDNPSGREVDDGKARDVRMESWVNALTKYLDRSMPVFLFYVGGVLKEEVVGVNTPKLHSLMSDLGVQTLKSIEEAKAKVEEAKAKVEDEDD
jgi:thiol-disulfide isomerase/thioredoxin